MACVIETGLISLIFSLIRSHLFGLGEAEDGWSLLVAELCSQRWQIFERDGFEPRVGRSSVIAAFIAERRCLDCRLLQSLGPLPRSMHCWRLLVLGWISMEGSEPGHGLFRDPFLEVQSLMLRHQGRCHSSTRIQGKSCGLQRDCSSSNLVKEQSQNYQGLHHLQPLLRCCYVRKAQPRGSCRC